jgi:hypothetical protein
MVAVGEQELVSRMYEVLDAEIAAVVDELAALRARRPRAAGVRRPKRFASGDRPAPTGLGPSGARLLRSG